VLDTSGILHCSLQGYAWEITTAEGGWGLDKVLQARQHVLNGITNGIDLDEWDPEFDEHTVAPYSAQDLGGKAACKEALQRELGLEVNPDVSALPFMSSGEHGHVKELLPERYCECDCDLLCLLMSPSAHGSTLSVSAEAVWLLPRPVICMTVALLADTPHWLDRTPGSPEGARHRP
jgi:hypothetical protein